MSRIEIRIDTIICLQPRNSIICLATIQELFDVLISSNAKLIVSKLNVATDSIANHLITRRSREHVTYPNTHKVTHQEFGDVSCMLIFTKKTNGHTTREFSKMILKLWLGLEDRVTKDFRRKPNTTENALIGLMNGQEDGNGNKTDWMRHQETFLTITFAETLMVEEIQSGASLKTREMLQFKSLATHLEIQCLKTIILDHTSNCNFHIKKQWRKQLSL